MNDAELIILGAVLGVGSNLVINAFSAWLDARVRRQTIEWEQDLERRQRMRDIELPSREDIERYGKPKESETSGRSNFLLLPFAVGLLLLLYGNAIVDYLANYLRIPRETINSFGEVVVVAYISYWLVQVARLLW
jgi:hypothetical protein